MHWAAPTFMIWVIELAGFFTMAWGSLLLGISISKVEESLKAPLTYILICCLTYLILGIYTTIAVTKQFSFESFLWVIVFILGLLVAIFLVIGGHKLLEEIKKS